MHAINICMNAWNLSQTSRPASLICLLKETNNARYKQTGYKQSKRCDVGKQQ